MRGRTFGVVVIGMVLAGVLFTRLGANQYYYFAAYVILQYVVLATAWNILGGYTGYVNFGTAAFFALGAYTSVVLIKGFAAPLPVLLAAGAAVAGLLGLGIGYLTLPDPGIASGPIEPALQAFGPHPGRSANSRAVAPIRRVQGASECFGSVRHTPHRLPAEPWPCGARTAGRGAPVSRGRRR